MKAPCKDCPDRQVNCHSTCEKYIEFKKESDRLREERFAKGEANRYEIERNNRRYKHFRNHKRR